MPTKSVLNKTVPENAKLSAELGATLRKEVFNLVAKWTVAVIVVLVLAVLTGWWLVLKPAIVDMVGGVQSGGIIAFDDPRGCSKLGDRWEDANFGGQILVGAIKGDARWEYHRSGGSPSVTLRKENIPPIYLRYHSRLSGNVYTVTAIEGLTLDKPNNGAYLETTTAPPTSIDIMPPYVPLYFCKRKT